jgi:hypothetical membrane protein
MDATVAVPLLLMGVVAPVLYAFTVAWGATLFPEYSHLADPISSLTQAGRERTEVLQALFFGYNVLVIGYGTIGMLLSFGRWPWVWSFALLIATALAGLLLGLFPQDAIGSPISAAGWTHIALAAIASFGSMGAIACGAEGYRVGQARPLMQFSIACLVIVFCSGISAGLGIGTGWPIAGLLERITIGAFELWLLVSAVALLVARMRARVAIRLS